MGVLVSARKKERERKREKELGSATLIHYIVAAIFFSVIVTPSDTLPCVPNTQQATKLLDVHVCMPLFLCLYIAIEGNTIALGIVVGVSVLPCVVSILVPVLIFCCLGVSLLAAIGRLSKNKREEEADLAKFF